MSRFFKTGLAALAAASAVACSDSAVSPGDMRAPGSVALARAVGQGGEERVVEGEILVKFKTGIDETSKARGRGLGVLRKGIDDAFVVLKGNKGSEHANANSLKNDPDVEWAEPNYIRTIDTIDPKLWAFRNPGGLNMRFTSDNTPIPSSYASILDADEDNVENYAANGADVVVGSIDTGVDLDHPELAGRLINGTDFINGGTPEDEDGHGTHTSGTMAGTNVGVAGVSGAAAHVKVLVQRVCGPSGCPTSAIINAINAVTDWSIANGNKVVAINMSLGGSSESTGEKTAIQRATNAGILVIASAGNNGSGKVACPACDDNAISVAATNWKDEKTSYSQSGKGLDIAAPGGECYSNTTPEGCIYSSYMGGGYAWLLGTSMAAPQVTGTAAIVASKTGLRGANLRSRILNTTDKPGALSRYKVGRLNSYRAVTNTSLAAGQ
jgi:subtilisin family serine protease